MATDIRQSARKFREFWTLAKDSEVGGYQKFWISLLGDVLGMDDVMSRISFQSPVQLKDTTKFLDAWIPETRVLIEHKARGVKLDAPQSGHGGKTPFEQALEYNIARPYSEKARWIVTCNFAEIWVYDMDHPLEDPQKILLANLPKEVSRLGFLVDTSVKTVREKEMDISIKAGRIVGELYRALRKRYADPDSAETLKALNRLCVRLVFCFYAEDADIFPKDALWTLLKNTEARNLRRALLTLFRTLDTPEAERDPYLEPELAAFPYTNGGLFRGVSDAEIPPLDDEIRELLVKSSDFDWHDISPTIFGALFESTLNPETRRAGGMVYTSVENIHKVIDPLFMNDLKAELESIKSERTIAVRRAKASAFQDKLGSLTFLDPACGSGNFLTETFLSLRKLENEAIVVGERLKPGEVLLNLDGIVKVSIKQFHGIEINDFAVSVAKTAMWISEAKMLNETANILHAPPKYLPLHDYDGIVEGNALRMDWPRADYIMGNPPFRGTKYQSPEQKADLVNVSPGLKPLDYVCGWFKKANDLSKQLGCRCAFVATNSIAQGEQVAPLWRLLDCEIDFAWRQFQWDSEATEKAHVHCVIVGFHSKDGGAPGESDGMSGAPRTPQKTIFDGKKVIHADHINGYLLAAPDVFIHERKTPLCPAAPRMIYGSKPVDGGNLILTPAERDALVSAHPETSPFIRRYMGSDDLINDKLRYCLWLKDASPRLVYEVPEIRRRVMAVQEARRTSSKTATQKWANNPSVFIEDRQPENDYLILPVVSSEKRPYMPIGYVTKDVIANANAQMIPLADKYAFGVLMSSVHNFWLKSICGRLETRYAYSATIVYNNFPWPDLHSSPSPREKISAAAQAILDARARYPDCSLKILYSEVSMPPDLRAAHEANDRAVLAAYGLKPDTPEPEIVAHLFGLYAKATLATKEGNRT